MSDSFGQWVLAIAGAVLGLLVSAYVVISTRRLDARLKQAPEPEAENSGSKRGTPSS